MKIACLATKVFVAVVSPNVCFVRSGQVARCTRVQPIQGAAQNKTGNSTWITATSTCKKVCRGTQRYFPPFLDLNKHVPVMSKRGPGDRGYVHYIGFLQLLPPDVQDDFHPLDHLQPKNVVGGTGWATGFLTGAFYCQFRQARLIRLACGDSTIAHAQTVNRP